MDITPNYNLLLGRAWLHPIGVIPSTLHKKMKIPWTGGIAVVLGNGEILASFVDLKEEMSFKWVVLSLWTWLTMDWRVKGTLWICSHIVAMRWLQWWKIWDTCLVWVLEKKGEGGEIPHLQDSTDQGRFRIYRKATQKSRWIENLLRMYRVDNKHRNLARWIDLAVEKVSSSCWEDRSKVFQWRKNTQDESNKIATQISIQAAC